MNVIDCPVACQRRTKLDSFAFKSREVYVLLSIHDPHGGVDPLELLPMNLGEQTSFLAPKFSMVFHRLMRI